MCSSDLWNRNLDDLARFDADHLVPDGLAIGELVVGLLLIEEYGLNNPGVLQEFKSSVDRGFGNAHAPPPQFVEQILRFEDPFHADNRVEHLGSFGGKLLPVGLEMPAKHSAQRLNEWLIIDSGGGLWTRQGAHCRDSTELRSRSPRDANTNPVACAVGRLAQPRVTSDMTANIRTCTATERTLLERTLVAVPIYNEQRHVSDVLGKVRKFAPHVLAIDDGSTDHTPTLLAMHSVEVIRHAENRGYGRSMLDAFRWAGVDHQDWVITMDCDEQHEPESIPDFLHAMEQDDADVISGSRYLASHDGNSEPPSDRRAINTQITEEINQRLGLRLTDGFCGFKAYRVTAVKRLNLDVNGYDFPMQFWVQAVAHGLRIRELPVRLIYNDPNRSFGGPLDNPVARLAQYRQTLHAELLRCRRLLPESAWRGLPAREQACCGCGH